MIIKIQISMAPDDSLALVYDQTKEEIFQQFPSEDLPGVVRAVVQRNGGKAYFEASLQDGKLVIAHEAPWQEW